MNSHFTTITPHSPNSVKGLNKFIFSKGNWKEKGVEQEIGLKKQISGTTLMIQERAILWRTLTEGIPKSTATPNVTIINDFFMPQLKRNRRIWVYLPLDYHQTEKRYPVIYMHDGQNLFDAMTSFSGEWQVDETLNILQAHGDYGAIVVGVDNGGINRLNEYSPWRNPNYGGGQGDGYMDFIVKTLKPYIDQNYKTLPQRETTALIGSSMGGLISMYGGIKYTDVFSKLGIFSPSFWFGNNIYKFVRSQLKHQPMKVYLLCALHESKTMVSNLNRMYETLVQVGFTASELSLIVRPDGQHSEWFWAREFPIAYQWLFNDLALEQHEDMLKHETGLFRNANSSLLKIEEEPEQSKIIIRDKDANEVGIAYSDKYDKILLPELESGLYYVEFQFNRRTIYRKMMYQKP